LITQNSKANGEPNKSKILSFKGPWIHPEIPNPEFVEQVGVYKRGPVGYVGIEVWQVKAGTLFSDFIVTDSVSEAEKFEKDRKAKKDDEEKAKKKFDDANPEKSDEEAATPDSDFEDEAHDEL